MAEARNLCDNLNAQNKKQLLDVKALLEARCSHSPGDFRPIDSNEIKGLEEEMKRHTHHEVYKMMDEYTNKLASAWPKEIKPGMVFKKLNQILEFVSNHPDGYGVTIMEDGKDIHKGWMKKGELSPNYGWKYLRG